LTVISATRPAGSATAPLRAVLRAVLGGIRAWRRRRAHRIAMLKLLELDPHRLDDLGLCLSDVQQAARHRR